MTPEEQFMRIENALRHAAEIQARHEEVIARHAEAIAQDQAAIRDLIVVSRTLLDSAKRHDAAFDRTSAALDRAEEKRAQDREDFNVRFNALLQAQLETEQKLQRWIDRQGRA